MRKKDEMKQVKGSQKVSTQVQNDLNVVRNRIIEAAKGYPKLTEIAAAVARGQIARVKDLEIVIKQLPANERPSILSSKEIVENLRSHISEAKFLKANGRRAQMGAANADCYRLPGVSMSEHLRNKTRAPVIQSAIKCLDLAVSGSWSCQVILTSDPAKVSMSTITYADWENTYRGAYKSYPKTGIKINIVVPKGWLFRVAGKNLQAIDGLFTLDAPKLYWQNSNSEVFAARWVEQSRGKNVKVVSGFIAVTKDRALAFHGATKESAIRGLMKKIRIASDPDFPIKLMKESIDRFCKRHENSNFSVAVNDARESGACDYGIRSWCERVAIAFERGAVPVNEVLDAYRQVPLPEVRRAILYAARRWAANEERQQLA